MTSKSSHIYYGSIYDLSMVPPYKVSIDQVWRDQGTVQTAFVQTFSCLWLFLLFFLHPPPLSHKQKFYDLSMSNYYQLWPIANLVSSTLFIPATNSHQWCSSALVCFEWSCLFFLHLLTIGLIWAIPMGVLPANKFMSSENMDLTLNAVMPDK